MRTRIIGADITAKKTVALFTERCFLRKIQAAAQNLLISFFRHTAAAVRAKRFQFRSLAAGFDCHAMPGFGIGMEAIPKWGTWMDWVSIYIIPIGATFGAISWFYIMKKEQLMDAVGTGSKFWYAVGRYLYVPAALILCLVALFMKVAF